MTSRSASRRRGAAPTSPPAKKAPVIPIALGLLALVVVIGLIVAFTGGDDGGDDVDAVDPGASSPAATSGEDDDGGSGGGDGRDAAYGEVTIDGDALPTLGSGGADPAVGTVPPALSGRGLDGSPTTVGGGPGAPTLVAFLAHWCPHCQRELPILVDEAEAGTFDGLRMVAVLTGTNADYPNFPPGDWLEDEGWTGDVLLDDRSYSAAQAWGLSGYPYMVLLDADGEVVARTSGELGPAQLADLADAARG